MRIMTMKAISKVAIISASILSIGALTACQTTPSPQESKSFKKHQQHMSPEMAEKRQAYRTERKAAIQQAQSACDGKAVGQDVQIKVGDKVINGTCAINFKVDQNEMKQARADQRPMRGEMRGLDHKRGEPLTDTQRAELTEKYDQRLANRQAMQEAFIKACQGQTDGKNVQIKLDGKAINGQCQVNFQPKTPKTN